MCKYKPVDCVYISGHPVDWQYYTKYSVNSKVTKQQKQNTSDKRNKPLDDRHITLKKRIKSVDKEEKKLWIKNHVKKKQNSKKEQNFRQ